MIRRPTQRSPFENKLGMVTDYVSNKNAGIALVVIVIVLVLLFNFYKPFNNIVKDTFANVFSFFPSKSTVDPNVIKDLGIIFIYDPSNEACREMARMFKFEGTYNAFEIIDISVPEQKDFATKIGALERGVPNFVSKKLGVGFIGKKDSSKDLVETLVNVQREIQAKQAQDPEGSEGSEGQGQGPDIADYKTALQQLGVVMFKMDTCGHCRHVKDEIDSLGLGDVIEIVDVSSPQAQQYASEFGISINGGVPLFYCRATGKTLRGSRPIKALIEEFAKG